MNTLARYLEVIVDPTFDDFYLDRTSVRLAYLACVAIFHAVDRAAEESGKSSATIRQVTGDKLALVLANLADPNLAENFTELEGRASTVAHIDK